MGLLALAGALSGAGNAVKDSLAKNQDAMIKETAERSRQAYEDARQEKNLKAAKELQQDRQNWEGGAAQRAIDTQTDPTNVAKLGEAADSTKRRELESYVKPGGLGELAGKKEALDFKNKLDAQLASSDGVQKLAAQNAHATWKAQRDYEVEKSQDPAWLKANEILKKASETELQKLQLQAEKFKVANLKEDRDLALKSANASMAIALMKSADLEITRLSEIKMRKEIDFVSAGTPEGKFSIEQTQKQIDEEKKWLGAARSALAKSSTMVDNPVNPTAATPKLEEISTEKWGKLQSEYKNRSEAELEAALNRQGKTRPKLNSGILSK